MNHHQIDVVGAGPARMMPAAELTPAGVDVVMLERRPTIEPERIWSLWRIGLAVTQRGA